MANRAILTSPPWKHGDRAIFIPRNELVTVSHQYECEGGWGNVMITDADGDEHIVNNWQLKRAE